MSTGQVYKFVGSEIAVQTGLGAAKTITGISAADPVVVTSATHGFAENSVVKLTGIAEPYQLDGEMFVVGNPASGTYELVGVDGTDHESFTDDSPGQAEGYPVTFSEFCEVTAVSGAGGAAQQFEVTTVCSTVAEFEQGLKQPGTLTLNFHDAPLTTVQQALEAANVSGEQIAFMITYPNDGGIRVIFGTVSTTSFEGSVGGVVWTGSATIQTSGVSYVLEPVAA